MRKLSKEKFSYSSKKITEAEGGCGKSLVIPQIRIEQLQSSVIKCVDDLNSQ